MKKTKKITMFSNLALAAVLFFDYLLRLPVLHPFFAEGSFALLVYASLFLTVNCSALFGGLSFQRDEFGRFGVNVDGKITGFQKSIKLLLGAWAIYFAIFMFSSPLFHAYGFRDQLGEQILSDFGDDIQLLDLSQVPIVDKALASTLADKKLGENPGMGSQVFLGEPVIQQVQGDLVWIVPLQHSGFFKWFQNRQGSAGYIRVSATNQQDIEFVEVPIKYQPNSFFWDDITRYLRTVKAYVFTGITDYSFEIDDFGQPYWIITTYQNQWLYTLPEATGVITLHATTGETAQYSIENVPDWVDRVQPEDFITTQIDQQGLYVHGIFNFSNKDKFVSSKQKAIIYNEGNCYLFTGLTSVGSDESAIGFMMVDMVTKESKLYQIPGATENKAMESAEGQVQQFGYKSTSPIIINHNGIPTYFITLKDNGGLIKQYAFVSVSDVTTVGAGETISLAIRAYNTALNATNSFAVEEGELLELTGTVERIASESDTEGLVYKVILAENTRKIFILSPDLSEELALTREGDQVSIGYYDSDEGILHGVSFDNKEYNQK